MEDEVNHNTNKSELWSLSLRDLFYKYVRYLPIFVLSVAIGLFGAYAYLRYATSIYSTSATMVIKSEQQGGKGDKFNDIFGGGNSQNLQNEIEILKSSPLMARVVEKKNLQFTYYAVGKIKTINIYKYGPFIIEPIALSDSNRSFSLKIKFINNQEFKVNDDNTVITYDRMFKNQNGTFRLKHSAVGGAGKDFKVEYTPTQVAASMYAGALKVTPKSAGAGILTISTESTNPNLGADIVNQLMAEYSGYNIELKNKSSDKMLDFIDVRLGIIGKELDSVQDKMIEYARVNNIINIESQSGSFFENISEADKAINEQQMQYDVALIIEEYLKNKRNQYGQVIVPSSLGLNDGTLNGLVSGYNTLQLERQRLLDGNVPEGHPLVIENKQQIEKVRQSILENLSNIKQSYRQAMQSFRTKSIESQSQLKTLPVKEKGYYEIKRQADYKQAIVNLLQEKREETAISSAATTASVDVVEYAYPSGTPIKPNRRSIQIMAILIGLAVPALFVFAGEVLNDKVSTRFDIEKLTTAPILGEIGHSYSDKVLMVNSTTRSMVAEQFRIVRSNLQYVIGKADKFTLLVTSSFSGEGKSFLSTNVAAVLALAGKKTIIFEFDIRKPKVISGLNMPKRPGITNFLVGKSENLDELVMKVPDTENLYVLACGPIPPNPSELLLGSRIDDLFTWAKSNYDIVIIDTAPVGMVSDAQTLCKFADATLYLVRQGHTFKKQVVLIDEFYREKKLPKVSIIINDVKMKAGYGYYGYGRYGYGYGYGYGSYYEEEHGPKNLFEKIIYYLDVSRFFKKKNNN